MKSKDRRRIFIKDSLKRLLDEFDNLTDKEIANVLLSLAEILTNADHLLDYSETAKVVEVIIEAMKSPVKR